MTKHPEKHRKYVLERIIRENKFTIGAELGVQKGVTHQYLLDVFPNLTLIGVDIKKQTPADLDRSIFYEMKTSEAADKIKDSSLDFIFIDANHSYKYVKEDIIKWSPKVKLGGYIIGHDYNNPVSAPGVTRAVNECFQKYQLEFDYDMVWYVRKII